MNFQFLQHVIIYSIIRSDTLTDVVKLQILSYFFFNFCWDFNYYGICSDIDNGSCDFKNYDFDKLSKND